MVSKYVTSAKNDGAPILTLKLSGKKAIKQEIWNTSTLYLKPFKGVFLGVTLSFLEKSEKQFSFPFKCLTLNSILKKYNQQQSCGNFVFILYKISHLPHFEENISFNVLMPVIGNN